MTALQIRTNNYPQEVKHPNPTKCNCLVFTTETYKCFYTGAQTFVFINNLIFAIKNMVVLASIN